MDRLAAPAVIAIFGASGDLTKRKLIPALFNLFLDGQLPGRFTVLGISRKGDTEGFRNAMADSLAEHSRRGDSGMERWPEFAARIAYIQGDYGDPNVYRKLAERIEADEKEWGGE